MVNDICRTTEAPQTIDWTCSSHIRFSISPQRKSWLGAIFKGNRQWGPDFLEAGDRVLDALELSSPFTWNLAHKDLIIPDEKAPEKEKALYGEG
jgi:hypothetical protein